MDTIALRIGQLLTYRFRIAVYTLSFAIPFLIASPQFLTGTLINCLLFLSAQKLPRKALIPVLMLPSVGAMANGMLFGPQTVFLYYFLPFIWIGNYVLVSLFSGTSRYPYVVRVMAAGAGKYLVLQLFAQAYVRAEIVPPVFAVSMGYVQLLTSFLGGMLALGVMKGLSYERNENAH